MSHWNLPESLALSFMPQNQWLAVAEYLNSGYFVFGP